jgi:hypothetical protein
VSSEERDPRFDLLARPATGARRPSALILLPLLGLTAILGYPLFKQAVWKTPVAQYPLAWSEIAGTAIRTRWRPIPGEDVTCDVQVARESGFDDVVYEEEAIEGESSGRIPVAKGKHYWRARCSSGGETHRWSSGVPFWIR